MSWDLYCIICGGPFNNVFLLEDEIHDERTGKNFIIDDWLEDIFLITNENKLIETSSSKQVDEGLFFKINHIEYGIPPVLWPQFNHSNQGRGIVCHHDCYIVLKTNFNYELLFRIYVEKSIINMAYYHSQNMVK